MEKRRFQGTLPYRVANTYQKKNINDITVKDLAEKSGVSRSTFYRHYSIPADVLIDYLDTNPFGFTAMHLDKELDEKENIRIFYQYFDNNKELVQTLIMAGMAELLRNIISKHIRTTFSETASRHGYRTEYQIAALIGLCSEILICWNKRGRVESVDEMTEIVYSIVSKFE